jgi:hypothetical protein
VDSRRAQEGRLPDDHPQGPQRAPGRQRPDRRRRAAAAAQPGYKAIYPQETINGHRAFIARRRAARPSEEYRTPADEEWAEFLGHFERRKVALGDCGRAYGTSCPHEHSCVRCPVLRIDPGQRPRLADIRDNLTARIAEAGREGWLGEAEGLRVSLAAARDKLAQLDERTRRAATVSLGIPAYRDIAARTATVPGNLP